MKKAVFIIFFIPVCVFSQIWHDRSFTTEKTLYDIVFTDSLNGFISGDSSLLLKTSDAGENWFPADVPVQDNGLLNILAPDDTSLYILSTNYTSGDCFLISSDNGNNWEIKEFPVNRSYLFNMDFLNADTGFVSSLSGKLYRTTDRLASWEKIHDTNNNGDILDVTFRTADTGWVCGGRWDIIGFIKKTTDGGVSWETGITTPEPVRDIYIFNDDTLYAVGGDPEYGGRIYISTDGGDNWIVQTAPPFTITFASVSFVNPSLGWVAGGGRILNTTDYGENWDIVSYEEEFIHRVRSFDQKNFWFTGSRGFLKQYVDTTGDTTVTGLKRLTPDKTNATLNIYPNPFNSQANIIFFVPESGYANLAVFDIQGRKTAQLIDGPVKKGAHVQIFSPKHFASGIYLINLLMENERISKKITYIK